MKQYNKIQNKMNKLSNSCNLADVKNKKKTRKEEYAMREWENVNAN